MSIIVEDGTGKPDANSFVTVEQFKAYAQARGVDLSKYNDDDISSKLIAGAEYISAYESKLQGTRPNFDQGLAFPRSGIIYNSLPIDQTIIPNQVKLAQMAATVAAISGVNLLPTLDQAPIKRDTIGPLTTEWDTSAFVAGTMAKLPAVDALLKLFMHSMTFLVRRV